MAMLATLSLAAALALAAPLEDSAELAPLTPMEQQELIEAYVTHRLCQPFVDYESQIYFRELKYNATKDKPELAEFFRGVDAGISERQIAKPIVPQYSVCAKVLPTAFKGLELFKQIK